jgi:hypothetical protein
MAVGIAANNPPSTFFSLTMLSQLRRLYTATNGMIANDELGMILKEAVVANLKALYHHSPRVVTGEKNSPTVAHACRKRRLKWALPWLGVGAQG